MTTQLKTIPGLTLARIAMMLLVLVMTVCGTGMPMDSAQRRHGDGQRVAGDGYACRRLLHRQCGLV